VRARRVVRILLAIALGLWVVAILALMATTITTTLGARCPSAEQSEWRPGVPS